MAGELGTQLHIVSAYTVSMSQAMRSVQELHSPGPGAGAYNRLIEQQGQQAQNTADAVAETLREMFPNGEVATSAVPGAPAEELLAQAARLGLRPSWWAIRVSRALHVCWEASPGLWPVLA